MGGFSGKPIGEIFDQDSGALVTGLSLALPPPAMAEALAAAAAIHAMPGDPRTSPAWMALVIDALPVGSDVPAHHQLVMSPDSGFVLLGCLQAWSERARRGLPVATCDQLDAVRADAYRRWRDLAKNFRDRG